MSGRPATRYPFKPLADICRARHRPRNEWRHAQTEHLNDVGVVAQVAGIDHNTARDWERRGVTESGADRVAVILGYHPANIWPDWGRRERAA